MKAVGISGTRDGMNSAQFLEVQQILEDIFDITGIFLHGDCKGVDEEAHMLARRIGYRIEIYPPSNPKHRAFCDGDVVHPPAPYLVRNRLIVDNARSMLIVPKEAEADAPRSGTWYTYRYSLESRRPTTLVVGGRFEYTPVDDAEFVEDLDPTEYAPEHDDIVRLPPLKVQSWRELPESGRSEISPDDLL